MARNANEVRRLSDLPKWFDISKYKDATTLNHRGWYENLFIRSHYLTLFRTPIFMVFSEHDPESIKRIISELGYLRHTPIWENSDQVKQKLLMLSNDIPSYRDTGVRPITIIDLHFCGVNIEDAMHNYDQQTLDKELPSGFMKVNLDLPENILIDQFMALLKKSKGKVKKVEKLEFGKWIKFGVLPYLDLKIWELESGKTIINRVMADAIFPLGEGGEEAVRKTTAKLADELLEYEHLDKLAAIAGAI